MSYLPVMSDEDWIRAFYDKAGSLARLEQAPARGWSFTSLGCRAGEVQRLVRDLAGFGPEVRGTAPARRAWYNLLARLGSHRPLQELVSREPLDPAGRPAVGGLLAAWQTTFLLALRLQDAPGSTFVEVEGAGGLRLNILGWFVVHGSRLFKDFLLGILLSELGVTSFGVAVAGLAPGGSSAGGPAGYDYVRVRDLVGQTAWLRGLASN